MSNFILSNTPLNAGNSYLGKYIDIKNYSSAIISILGDTETRIDIYQSIDKQNTILETFNYTDINNTTQFIMQLSMPYAYITITNTTLVNQSNLIFCCKFTENELVSADSNSVEITNPFIQVKSYSTLAVQDSNVYSLLNTRGTSQLHNGAISAGNNTSILNLSSKKVKNLTIYGTQDSNSNELIVMFSNDGSTFYKSQYSYIFGTGISGNFGFNLQACPRYLAIQSKNTCNLVCYVDYC